MSAFDASRFRVGAGRPRPPYQPKVIRCAQCGAGVEVKDERAELTVCAHCGAHLKLSREEVTLLEKGGPAGRSMPLEIGDSFRYEGVRFEVIGRMVFLEEGGDITRQYLLYHPGRGTRWLDEYEGEYTISWTTHVKPDVQGDLYFRPVSPLRTFDGSKWRLEERGVYELAYVDGALPWVARAGDRITYVTYVDDEGTREYEFQSTGNEVEYTMGRPLPLGELVEATGKTAEELEASTVQQARNEAWGKPYYQALFLMLGALAVNGGLLLYSHFSGRVVLDRAFSPAELASEVETEPFQVVRDNDVVAMTFEAPVDNAWLSADVAMLDSDGKVLHGFACEVSYYHGWERLERWKEGGHKVTRYLRIPRAGDYRLRIKVDTGAGESGSSAAPMFGLHVRVRDGAKAPYSAMEGLKTSGVVLLLFVTIWMVASDRRKKAAARRWR